MLYDDWSWWLEAIKSTVVAATKLRDAAMEIMSQRKRALWRKAETNTFPAKLFLY
jgi:hypothetical protein